MSEQKQWDTPPAMQIETDRHYRVTMETNKGTIELELFPEHAPTTVNTFVFLVFITHAPQPHLDGKHTVFGKVTAGHDVVDAIAAGDTMNKVAAEPMG
jgi:cyclophilin family peptidyl-prolyl cis-trans isomerase